MQSFYDIYGSPGDARGYAAELNYNIGHPEEEGFTEEKIMDMKKQISEIREYLSEIDEIL